MSATDPMHTFLLGIVRKETELNLSQLDSIKRTEFVRRVKSLRVPYDIGRLPTNIFDHGDGLSGITAAQLKLYILIYARPCLYKLLPWNAYKSLVLLSEIVTIIALLREQIGILYRLIHDHQIIIIMCLHLPDMISDFGPPNSFWCFSYERLNGTLAGIPNSHRSIESEFSTKFIQDILSSHYDLPSIEKSMVPIT